MKKYFIIVLLTLLMSGNVVSSDTNILFINNNTSKVNIFDYIEILEDKGAKLTIDDVTKDAYKNSFQAASIIGNSFGISESAYWVRFSIKVSEDTDDTLYLELAYPLTDCVRFYIPTSDNSFIEKKSGELTPLSLKDINYRNPLFNIPREFAKVQTYYMRVKTDGSIQIPLNIFKSSALIEEVDKVNFIMGGYYGNMFLLMIAAFIAFLKIRDQIFLTYSIYLFSYLFFQLTINGFFYQHFLPFPIEYSNKLSALSLGFVVIGGALFSGDYLQIWSGKHPKIRFLFYGLIVGATLGTIVAFTISLPLGLQISTIMGVSLPPTVLLGASYSLYSGYKPAQYFLVAWCVFLLGIFVAGLLFIGFVPHTFLTAYSMQIGSTFELFLLSYALISRFNILYLEKEEATQNATKYLNQINEGLESLVEERTRELEDKNELLSELAIKDTMTGMLNHNTSIEILNSMIETAKRYHYKLAVIMVDIDLFKLVNDKYGHPAGDQVIIEVANIIHRNIRESDACGRYGGEEFIILLHDMNEEDARDLAERMRISIESLKISTIKNQQVSASFGISMFDELRPDLDLIKQSDNALYISKQMGRNRVTMYA